MDAFVIRLSWRLNDLRILSKKVWNICIPSLNTFLREWALEKSQWKVVQKVPQNPHLLFHPALIYNTKENLRQDHYSFARYLWSDDISYDVV